MDSLDDVMAQLATADFKGAGKVARAIDARVGRRVRTLSPRQVSRDGPRHAPRHRRFR